MLLALVSGLLFGMVPVRQVLRAESLPGHQSRRRPDLVAHGVSRCAMCCWSGQVAHLRRAGDLVAGGGAWDGALTEQQFRF